MSSKDAHTSKTNTGHICVAIRIRPLLDHETNRGETEAITIAPIKSFPSSNSMDKGLTINRNLHCQLTYPSVALKQNNEARKQSLRQSQFYKRDNDQEKEEGYSLKGGTYYAAQVRLSAVHRKQKIYSQTSSMDQLRGLESTSEMLAFDAVLGPGATQEDVFDLLQLHTYCDEAMLEGKAAAIVCYGQTGSGKSFTMSGPFASTEDYCVNLEIKKGGSQQDVDSGNRGTALKEESGIAYQAVLYISQYLKKLQQSMHPGSGLQIVARASYIELYQERIHDLLQERCVLKCRWSAERRAFYLEDLLQVECCTMEDFLLVLREGQSCRQQAAHVLNATSSRSHALFIINFETTTGDSRFEDSGCNSYIRYGKLTLVDLAGSERLKDTGNAANNDTRTINCSLFALSNVIQALSSTQPVSVSTSSSKKNPSVSMIKATGSTGARTDSNGLFPQNGKNSVPSSSFVPYRSSVLTKLLMDSLEGNSRTLFIICVTPSSRFVEESLRTLHFAQRVRQIRSVAVERIDSQVKERRDFLLSISQLKTENIMLRSALGIASDAKDPLNEELVKQHVERLVANRAGSMCKHHLVAKNGSNSSPLVRNNKACQASLSSNSMKLCHETSEVQKIQYHDDKPNINEMGDSDGSHLLVSNSQQLPQLVPPVQYSQPFSSLQHHEFHEQERYGKIRSRCSPALHQGCNALEILKNLPDTTFAMFNNTQRPVISTQHLDPTYEANIKEERISTSANATQKYGFRPQQRR